MRTVASTFKQQMINRIINRAGHDVFFSIIRSTIACNITEVVDSINFARVLIIIGMGLRLRWGGGWSVGSLQA